MTERELFYENFVTIFRVSKEGVENFNIIFE
jgi:hypothetical protein